MSEDPYNPEGAAAHSKSYFFHSHVITYFVKIGYKITSSRAGVTLV